MRNKRLREVCKELRLRLDRQAQELCKAAAGPGGCLRQEVVKPPPTGEDADKKGEKEKIVEEYLLSLAKAGAPALIGGEGYPPALPPRRPESLKEAKKLADLYLK